MGNEYQSSKLCEALYTKCEEKMDQLQVLRLPSMAKFNVGFLQCNQSFEVECVGPSKANYERRMKKVRHNPHILFFYSLSLFFCQIFLVVDHRSKSQSFCLDFREIGIRNCM